MILLTVGTQLPFDRLVEAVDRIAPELDEPVIAQVGKSKYICQNIEAHENFGPVEFQEYLRSCSKIISHAGIGTILNAKKFGNQLFWFQGWPSLVSTEMITSLRHVNNLGPTKESTSPKIR